MPKKIFSTTKLMLTKFYFSIKKNPITLVVLLSSIINFTYIYWSDPARPGALYSKGWYEIWNDQRYYEIMAKKISLLDFTPSNYEYPLGYPILGALCYKLFPQDPFLLPNLTLYTLSVIFFYLINIKLTKNKLFSLSSTFFLLLSGTFNRSITPWTSNVTLTLSIMSYYILLQAFSVKKAILMSFFCGYSFFTRYSDSLVLLPLLFFYTLKMFNTNHKKQPYFIKIYIKNMVVVILPFILIILLTFLINYFIFGNFIGNYLNSVKNEGFDPPTIWINKTIGMFLNQWIYHRETHLLSIPFIKENLILFLFPLGIFLYTKDNWTKHKLFILAFFNSLIMWLFLYIPFIAISPWDLKFGNSRYTGSVLPPLIIFSSYILLRSVKKPLNTTKYLVFYLLIILCIIFYIDANKPTLILKEKSNFSVETEHNQSTTANILDNNLETRWDTGRPRKNGDHIIINLNKTIKIKGIIINTEKSPAGCSNSYKIELSMDKINWKKVAEVKNEVYCYNVYKYFYPSKARYVKIQLLENEVSNDYWSIHEINLLH